MSDPVPGTERTVDVSATGDEIRARNATEAVAADVGFEEDERADLGHVAVELATNLVKYADGGTISIQHVESESESERGIRITSTDSGPGLPDADAAFAAGVSTGGTLGYGLSTVNQLVDTVEITPRDDQPTGTRIEVERWVKPKYSTRVSRPCDVGVATRSISSGLPNGDSFVVKDWGDQTLVGVIDGLGHGPKAHEAAVRARNYVESHYDRPLQYVFRGTERACKSTRGVVMALARFDWAEESVTVGNVGNIVVRVSGPEHPGFVVRRGVLGSNAPEPMVRTAPWEPQYTMVLHSDGVATKWQWDDVRSLENPTASRVSNWLLKHHGKDDDSTVVTVSEATHD